ncbi:MAG: flavodoxin [Oscillospiraceae bacterium]|nr:flavodoxin [Oscillospiraceae bacterium]MBQ9721838.1 flavodoxin [Oscillospiraceae bacterium]
MKAEVRYFSRGGNTKKLAEAIAEAIGTEAKTTAEPLTEDVDILFLGSSVYAYGVDDEVKRFIEGIQVGVGEVVNFSTAALVKSTYKQVGKLLKAKGIPQAKEEFYCKGSFGALHKGKPDAADCEAAAKFAKGVIK